MNPLFPAKGIHVVWDETGLAALYCAAKIGNFFPEGTNGWLVVIDGQMVGAVVFYDANYDEGFRPRATIAGAAETARWFNRRVLTAICTAMYAPLPNGLGFQRVTSFISLPNDRSVAVTKKIGFTEEGILRKAGPDDQDVMALGMLPDECPFYQADAPASDQPVDTAGNE